MRRTTFSVMLSFLMIGMFMTFQIESANAYNLDDLLKLSAQIQNQSPGIDLKLKTEKTEYAIGEDVVMEFQADKDCYLALIDIGTSGRTIFLFPNKWQPENRVEKDKTYRIPPIGSDFSFRVLAPTGMEHIKVLACLDPVLSKIESLQQELKQPIETTPQSGQASTGQVFLSMKDPGIVLKDIGLTFQKLDPSRWATKQISFKIVEAAAQPQTQPQAQTQPPAGSTSTTSPQLTGEVFKSQSGLYELRYDPGKWKLAASSFPEGDTAFIHIQTQMELNAISQNSNAIPIAAIKKEFIDSLQAQGSEATVKEDKEIRINDVPVTSLTVTGKTEGAAWTVRAYLWSGGTGTIKLIGGYPDEMPQAVKDELEKLLSGLKVLKPQQ